FAVGEADPEGPVLPLDDVARDGEAGPGGLGDLDGFQGGAGRADIGRVVEVALLLRDRQQLVVDQLDDLAVDEVHIGHDTVDGVRPAVVGFAVRQEGQHPEQAAAAFAGEVEVAGGQRAGAHQGEVGDAAPGHGGLPAGV